MSTGSETISKIEGLLNDAHITSVSADEIQQTIQKFQNDADIADFYDIGLWGYCEGDSANGKENITSCTEPKAEFYFNPASVLGLTEDQLEKELGGDMKKIMNVYKAVSKWMFIAYLIAFIATAAQLLVGVIAIFSRWGSCVTTIVSIVSFLFTLGASLTSTIMFSIAKGSLGSALKIYEVDVSMGENIYVATWLAVAFSLAATIFWMFSTCCCSGRSPYGHKDRRDNRGGITAEKAPYTYEPIGAAHPPFGSQPYAPQPYAPPPGHTTAYPSPANNNNNNNNNQPSSAYEPFRHV